MLIFKGGTRNANGFTERISSDNRRAVEDFLDELSLREKDEIILLEVLYHAVHTTPFIIKEAQC